MGAEERPLRLDVVDYRLSPMFLLRRFAEREPGLRADRVAGGGFANAVDPVLSRQLIRLANTPSWHSAARSRRCFPPGPHGPRAGWTGRETPA